MIYRDKEEEFREQQMQENGEDGRKEAVTGPWNRSTPTSAIESTPSESDEEKEKEEEVEVKPSIPAGLTSGGRYVPPHLRGQGALGGGTGEQTRNLEPINLSHTKKKSSAPQIADTMEFPSLGAAESEVSSSDMKGFQAVKHGGKEVLHKSNAPQVSLDNKYKAFRGNDDNTS